MTIVDNSLPASPRVIPVSGVGVDLALSLTRPRRPGRSSPTPASASFFTLNIDTGGLPVGPVTIKPVGLPALASCVLAPTAVNLTGQAQVIEIECRGLNTSRASRLQRAPLKIGTSQGVSPAIVVAGAGIIRSIPIPPDLK